MISNHRNIPLVSSELIAKTGNDATIYKSLIRFLSFEFSQKFCSKSFTKKKMTLRNSMLIGIRLGLDTGQSYSQPWPLGPRQPKLF